MANGQRTGIRVEIPVGNWRRLATQTDKTKGPADVSRVDTNRLLSFVPILIASRRIDISSPSHRLISVSFLFLVTVLIPRHPAAPCARRLCRSACEEPLFSSTTQHAIHSRSLSSAPLCPRHDAARSRQCEADCCFIAASLSLLACVRASSHEP